MRPKLGPAPSLPAMSTRTPSVQNFAQVMMVSSPALPTSAKPDSPIAQRKINEQNQPQPAMSKMSMRQVAAEEILSSEQTYVDQIHLCIESYKKPIQASKLLEDKVVRDLFSNVETIYALHVDFLAELKTRMRRWTSPTEKNSIGDVMTRLIPYLKIYQEYINNYENSIKVLNKLLEKNSKFVQLLNCLGSGSFLGKLGLDLLRGVPVQRITRYVLLLKQLLKYTPEDHVDFEQLSDSYDKMYALAEYINEKKRESESRTRLMHIAHHLSGNLDQLRESDSSPQIAREHKWKTESKSKTCDYCGQMAMGSHLRCKHDICKYRVHEECKSKAPMYCSDRTKVSLVKHNRYLIEEAEFMHKMTPLDHPDSRAKLCAALVLVVNDGLVIVHKSEHSDKYALLAFVRWFKKSTNEHAILNENVTDTAFSVTDPRSRMVHTFSTDSKEKKEHVVELVRSLMNKWHTGILEKQRETEEVKEQFKGLTFKILFTVPVHSSTEKEFIAYVVELRMESGSATLIKRYRQFLSLHKKLKTLYKNVPKFPGKKYVGNTAPRFVQKRCRQLEAYLNKIITFPGAFDVEEVRTFLMTTISSKGEDEKALIKRGWSKDKEKIEEISRQRSNTVSTYLETVRLSTYTPGASVYGYEPPRSAGEEPSGERTLPDRSSVDDSTATEDSSDPLTQSSGLVRTTANQPLGAIGRLSRGEGDMSTKDTALWERMQRSSGQVALAEHNNNDNDNNDEGEEGDTEATTIKPAGNDSDSDAGHYDASADKQRAVVLYDFVGQGTEELDIVAGDVVTVWERSNDEWWFGSVNGRDFGFFPKIYVQVLGLDDHGRHQ